MKNIILTGASRGIGREITLSQAKKGNRLAIIARNRDKLSEVLKEVQCFSPDSKMYVCDIANRERLKSTFDEIIRDFSKIDILINNSGIQAPIGPFYENDFTEWDYNINVNLIGSIFLIRLVLPTMIKNSKGKIINFSGGGATSPRPNFSAYATSKTALVRFTEVLSEELKEQGLNIYINSVAPGAVNTSMLNEVIEAGDKAGKEVIEALKREKEGGTDVSLILSLIDFLISDDSNGISGKLISAPWDRWREKEYLEELRNKKNLATLRRIDNKYFGEI